MCQKLHAADWGFGNLGVVVWICGFKGLTNDKGTILKDQSLTIKDQGPRTNQQHSLCTLVFSPRSDLWP